MVKAEEKKFPVKIQLCILLIYSFVLATNQEKNQKINNCNWAVSLDKRTKRGNVWTPHLGDIVKVREYGNCYDQMALYDAIDGTWLLLDDDDIRCSVSCTNLDGILDRNLIVKSSELMSIRGTYDIGTSLSFECREGYELSDGSRLTCLDDGTWDVPPPTCHRVQVPVPVIYAADDESILLHCIDDTLDQFLDNWIWMKDQRLLKPDGDFELAYVSIVPFTASLNVTKMRKSSEGIYTCVSMDFGGVTRHHSVSLLSKQHEDFVFDVEPRNVIVTNGKYTVLFCSARNAEISWTRNGKIIRADGQHYEILPNGALLIYSVDISVNGNYTCAAEHTVTKMRISRSVTVHVDVEVEDICGKLRINESSRTIRHPLLRRSKIVGGNEAYRGSHPWMALVEVQKVNGERKFCGGSLVNRQWVTTAAHCLDNVTDGRNRSWIRITLGKHTRQEKDDNEQVYDVAEVVIHAFYNDTTFDNDLALLRLSRKVHFTDHILPICLPSKRFMNKFYPAVLMRINGTVAGWGRMRDRGILSEYLREVKLPIVDIYECDRSAGEIVGKNVFCAGVASGEVDSCEGDSGGAFEIVHGGRTYLAGIVSWGIDCGRPKMYGFYTRVDRYIDYIRAYVFRSEKWSDYDLEKVTVT